MYLIKTIYLRGFNVLFNNKFLNDKANWKISTFKQVPNNAMLNSLQYNLTSKTLFIPDTVAIRNDIVPFLKNLSDTESPKEVVQK